MIETGSAEVPLVTVLLLVSHVERRHPIIGAGRRGRETRTGRRARRTAAARAFRGRGTEGSVVILRQTAGGGVVRAGDVVGLSPVKYGYEQKNGLVV